MKKIMNSLLMAALVCGLSLSATSCKDSDDDNNKSEEQQDQQAMEEQDKDNARIALLDYLADIDEVNMANVDSVLSLRFEANIGEAESEGATTRIVSINTMEAAAERFANMVGADIDENTSEYKWTDEKMGTMTYKKTNDGTSWATIDVDIRQVTGLDKIIFRSTEQSDANVSGKFKGRAYYRFGDVVCRKVKENQFRSYDEYWVCVRPAFGPEGKGDSHWACVNVLPDKNIYTFSEIGTMYFPTGLGENREHMQNLAEMVYAILNPTKWASTILSNVDNKKVKMFGDFSKSNLKYHNEYFWKNVGKAWEKMDVETSDDTYDIWNVLFESNKEDVADEVNNTANGLKLLYKGYSWVKKGKVIHLWQANYTSGSGANSNMHKVVLTEPRCDLTVKSTWILNFRKTGGNQSNYMKFFNPDSNNGDDMMRWCVRFATGKELATSKWNGDVKKAIPGVVEVYRYYRDVDPEGGRDLSKEPVADKSINF